MEQSELLRFVANTLEKLGIPYFVTGSMATVFYGEPRFTNDMTSSSTCLPARSPPSARHSPKRTST